jgi:predicted DNA-binding transcriptional regulator AlpA
MEKQVLTLPEFVKMYSLNEDTIRGYVSRSPTKLPKILRIGRSIRFTLEAIKEWEVAMTES